MAIVQIRPDLTVQQEALDALCRRHHITWLAIYGSALRDDFGAGSDIDLIAEFAPGQTPSLFGMLDLEQELSDLLTGRPIDLGTKRALNRWIRDRVLREARVLYDAA
jgi:predicted nucleotidyltransferase